MKDIEIRTLEEIVCPSAPLYSPDGKYVLYRQMTPDAKENRYITELYLHSKAGARRMTQGDGTAGALWLSDRTLLLWQNGAQGASFFTTDVDKDELVPYFTIPLPALDVYLLAGGALALLCYWDNYAPNRSKDWEDITEIPFWGSGRGIFAGYRSRVYFYDPLKKNLVPVTGTNTDVTYMTAADKTIVWAGSDYDSVCDFRAGVYSYDTAKGETLTLVEPGKMYVYGLGLMPECVMLIGSADKQNDAWQPGDIFRVGRDGGGLTRLTEQRAVPCVPTAVTDCALGGGRLTKVDCGFFYYLADNGYNNCISRIDSAGREEKLLSDPRSVDFFDVCGGSICYRGYDPTHGPELYENGRQLTRCSSAFCEEYTVRLPEPLSFTNSDGLRIDGWVVEPAGFSPDGSFPGILNIHGGPRCMYGENFFHEMQAEAAAGYFVFFCNPRGSDGRGKEFGDLYGLYGTVDYRDLMEFTDAVLEKYPQLDALRLGVSGGSYGGYMTNWIIGQTHRFAAAASQRSISNMIVSEYVSEIGYHWVPSEMGVSADDDEQALWAMSPLRYVKNVVTPTIFLQSDEDYLCPAADAAAMFTALKRKGVESKFCYFHGENHGLSRSGRICSRLHRLEEILGWFDKYLK